MTHPPDAEMVAGLQALGTERRWEVALVLAAHGTLEVTAIREHLPHLGRETIYAHLARLEVGDIVRRLPPEGEFGSRFQINLPHLGGIASRLLDMFHQATASGSSTEGKKT